MAKLVYAAITSLDGYVVDQQGIFEWAEPDAEVQASINDLRHLLGAYVYGRPAARRSCADHSLNAL